MAKRRGDRHRLIRWLWTSRRVDARLARLALLPLAGLWRLVMAARGLAYRRKWMAVHDLGLPVVSVGNLTVGGSGKTPVAAWIAAHFAARRRTPGVLLRGYGGDEAQVHADQVPAAVVVADPDRVAGAADARLRGAEVLVLDDAYQRLDVWRDLNIAVVSAETSRAVRWPVPAGPWREGLEALDRADALIITRKRAPAADALAMARELAARVAGPVAVVHLAVSRYRGLVSGRSVPAEELEGKRIVAAAAIADPDAFVAQLKATGAQVQVATWKDHHAYRDEDVAWLAHAARRADYVVMTRKDAVKLRDRWPASVPEPLVAELELEWEAGLDDLVNCLDALLPTTDPSQANL